MSRNASGTYTLAAGNPVVNGTTITVGWANGTLDDLATAMTDSLSRSGFGAMLAQFKAFDGTSSAPGISFANDLDCGVYRVGANNFKFQVNSVTVQEWTTAAVAFPRGMNATGVASAAGGTFTGGSAASGVIATGGTSGAGVTATGGATNGIGVLGTGGGASTGIGVKGVTAGTGEGVWGDGGGSGIGGRFVGGVTGGIGLIADVGASSGSSPLMIVSGSAPTTNLARGCLYVTTAGVLKIYDGSNWVSVGAQT